MHVIAKRTILFIDSVNMHSGVRLEKVRHHTVSASRRPQEAPDWIRDLPAFQHAVETGEITTVEINLRPAA